MSVNCPACGASVASLVFDGSGAASCPNCAGTIQFHGGSQPTVLLPSSGDSDASDATAVERAHHPLLGRYELLNELGHGGFGTVYRARDTQLDRIVALKIPHSGAFVSADEKARFLREAQTAAGLEHPAIVRVFDAGQINGTPYIASQLVEGKTLANVVAIRNLSTRESAELIARIGDALQHAHEHRLVHRDIKPGNIMVGPDGRPMLMDFGLAKDFQRDTNQTTEGWIKGTPAYMSPEQASGESQRIDRRTDIYSLGVVLYELLSGERAFRGTPQKILDAIRFEDLRALRSFSGRVPLDLQTICQKAVERDPARRYQSAVEFADDLRRWLSSEPIRARRIGMTGHVVRWVRRNPGVTASVTTIVAILTVATIVSSLLAYRERSALLQANRRLSQLCVVNAKLDEGEDLMASLPWLAEAYRLDREDETRSAASLLRLRSTIDAASKLERVWFHDAPITRLTVSRNGQRFASGSTDGIVRVWDVASGNLLREFSEGSGAPPAVEFLDEDHLLLRSQEALVVWNLKSDQKWAELTGLQVSAVVVSPKHDRVAIVLPGNDVRLWDWRRNDPQGPRAFKAQESGGSDVLVTLVFNREGTVLAVSSSNRIVRLWNTDTGELLGQLPPQLNVANAICFSSDGGSLAVATTDQRLQIWNASTLEPQYQLPPTLPFKVRQLEFSPDGNQVVALATAAYEPSISIWNVYERRSEVPPMVQEHRVNRIQFSPDQPLLLTACDDKRVRIWDTATGKLCGIPLLHGGAVTCACFLDSGRVVTGGSDQCVRQWRIAPPVGVQLAQKQPVSLCISPDGMKLAVAGKNHLAGAYDLQGRELHADGFRHTGSIEMVDYSADGAMIATGSADTTARIWNAHTGKPQTDPLPHPLPVKRIRFSPNCEYLATTCVDSTARLWNTRTGELDAQLQHASQTLNLAYSADGHQLAVATADRTVSIWDARPPWKKQPRVTFSIPADINQIAYHPTDDLLLIVGYDNVVRIWDTDKPQEVCSFLKHHDLIRSARFSADGQQAISASRDGIAWIWNSRSGVTLTREIRHGRSINDAFLTPDGLLAVTGGSDGNIRISDARTGDQIAPQLAIGDEIIRTCACEGRTIVTLTSSGKLFVHHLPVTANDQGDPIVHAGLLSAHRLQDQGGIIPISSADFRAAAAQAHAHSTLGIEFPQFGRSDVPVSSDRPRNAH